MSTFSTCTSTSRPPSPTDGNVLFETDTKNVIIWDGTNWRGYQNDGLSLGVVANSFSGSFDGSGDWIDCGSISSLLGASAQTFSFWFKPAVSGTGPNIGYRNSTTEQFTVINNNLVVRNGGTAIGAYTPPGGTDWQNYTIVYGSSNAELFINGSSIVSFSTDSTLPSTSSSFDLGRTFLSVSNVFYSNGLIDEAALWNVALDNANVSQIYNLGKPVDLSTNAASYNQSSNLTHWWRIGDHASDTSSGGGAVVAGNVIGNVENAANPGTNDGTGTAAIYSSTTP